MMNGFRRQGFSKPTDILCPQIDKVFFDIHGGNLLKNTPIKISLDDFGGTLIEGNRFRLAVFALVYSLLLLLDYTRGLLKVGSKKKYYDELKGIPA